MLRIYGNVDPELKDITIAICFTESSLNFDVKHTGSYNYTTTGICGLKTIWIEIIPEITSDNLNSLYAGSLVIGYLLNKYDDNLYLAIKHFKGAKKDKVQINKVLSTLDKINN